MVVPLCILFSKIKMQNLQDKKMQEINFGSYTLRSRTRFFTSDIFNDIHSPGPVIWEVHVSH